MNGARTAATHRRHLSLVGVFLIDPGPAYCVPEAGINYKRRMNAEISTHGILANSSAMS
jgi:hypothetical protein